jgi:hypothetical protein
MNNATFLLLTLFSMTITKPEVPVKPQIQRFYIVVQQQKPEVKSLYTMSDAELNALSVKKKAKLVHMSKKSFKEMTKVINHESGPKMQDKVLVAAVIFNRVHCKQFRNSVIKVINEPGQFYDVKHTRAGSANDKKAQLAILLAYRDIKLGKIPHNVLYFNSISYRTKSRRYVKYKHYNNYFIQDSKCKCKWCSGGQ